MSNLKINQEDDIIKTEPDVLFKKKRTRNVRRRHSSDESECEDEIGALDETRELQKLRRRPNGVSVITLATGSKISLEEEITCKDPFKVKTGGMVNMSALKSGKVKQVDDAYDTGIGTQFSAETNKRDEDEEMMKYIEEQLSKQKGQHSEAEDCDRRYLAPEEAALLALPEHLRTSSAHKSEEMLSNQMLSGIPEVDLGIEAKIKNIEATEEAKLKLLHDRRNRKDGPSLFVPANVAVNFVQHNRFNLENAPKRRKPAEPPPPPVQRPIERPTVSSEPAQPKKKGERATDDYHYEKFKKQFRRY